MTDVDYDFDAWYAENVKPVTIRLLGKTWELADVPATVVHKYERLAQWLLEQGEDVDLADLPEGFTAEDTSYESMLRDLAGEGVTGQWLAAGATEDHLAYAARQLYNLRVLRRSPEPEAPEPKTPPQRKAAAKKPPAAKKAAAARKKAPAKKPARRKGG